LLLLLSLAVAEAALLVLLLVFSSVLRVNFGVQLGDQLMFMYAPQLPEPSFTVRHAGAIGSVLFTFGCGACAAAWRYRRWRVA
jgi:hypothetical protein